MNNLFIKREHKFPGSIWFKYVGEITEGEAMEFQKESGFHPQGYTVKLSDCPQETMISRIKGGLLRGCSPLNLVTKGLSGCIGMASLDNIHEYYQYVQS